MDSSQIAASVKHIHSTKRWIARLMKYKLLYLLLAGALIWTLVFCYLPMAGIIMAFQKFNIFKGFLGSEFVGLENFVTIFSEPQFLKVFLPELNVLELLKLRDRLQVC